MVFYYTSGNLKALKNLLHDYASTQDISAYEYIKEYTEKCSTSKDDRKLNWIAETFLSYERHKTFLSHISSHLPEELNIDEVHYFSIILHGIIFHIKPNSMSLLYKCIFNLSKTLLSDLTKFLSSNEVLILISEVAQEFYDVTYITEKIIGPIFSWQPHIIEMAHKYSEYVKEVNIRTMKLPVVPIHPNVLNRKSKSKKISEQNSTPIAPPNSIHQTKKMLTKSVIDNRLQQKYNQNKQKAADLLNNIKNKNFSYAKTKSDEFHKKTCSVDNTTLDTKKNLRKTPHVTHKRNNNLTVKETRSVVKRLNQRIQLEEQEEVKWLQEALMSCGNVFKIDELQEIEKQENEKKRLMDIERKHLLGQISYEEAILAKKKFQENNKRKREELLKDKEKWHEQIERWRREETERNKKLIEKMAMIEMNVNEAKNEIQQRKKENVETVKKASKNLKEEALKVKQEELERKIKMIKEIKILALIARKARLPKVIDLTECSGLCFLCEMSIAELQERLAAMKISLKEELEMKKFHIKQNNLTAKKEYLETKKSIKKYYSERKDLRNRNNVRSEITLESIKSKELDDLKNTLMEKRDLRMKLTTK